MKASLRKFNPDIVSKFESDKYQVFLLACPAGVPVMFAIHPWFVINKKGDLSRWEVFLRPARTETSWGHLSNNFYKPFQGIPVFYFLKGVFWENVKILGCATESGDGRILEMIKFIEDSPNSYPHRFQYSLTGPNSNTYIQWVLDRFPDIDMKLPWNAFGKGHKRI